MRARRVRQSYYVSTTQRANVQLYVSRHSDLLGEYVEQRHTCKAAGPPVRWFIIFSIQYSVCRLTRAGWGTREGCP